LVTTDPAAMIATSPIVTPFIIVAREPTHTWSPIAPGRVTGLEFELRRRLAFHPTYWAR
jgi:hypothetical protein